MKRCVIRVRGSWDRYEVWATSLRDLYDKALQVLNLNTMKSSVSLVLARDGAELDSDDFLFCLPDGIEIIALAESKTWSRISTDGGTVWMKKEEETRKQRLNSDNLQGNLPGVSLCSEPNQPGTSTSADENGNVENVESVQRVPEECLEQRQPCCQQTQPMSLLLTVCHKVKTKLSPKMPRKNDVK
ncbi:DNA fragmentation factor subunit alpha-like [Gastrophryne carolinensis]